MIVDRRQRKHREVRRALSAVLLALGLIVPFDVRLLAVASVSGTKTVSGTFTPAYTVVLTNISGSAQSVEHRPLRGHDRRDGPSPRRERGGGLDREHGAWIARRA